MLAILARVLMLVACVPLLQPTGFCICKAGWPSRTASPSAVVVDGSPVAQANTLCCTKGRCAEPVNKPFPSRERPPSPRPAPTDDQHMPGCPASTTADASKWVEPTQTPTNALPPLPVVAYLHVKVAATVSLLVPTFTNWPASPPLYLSHCSLVI